MERPACDRNRRGVSRLARSVSRMETMVGESGRDRAVKDATPGWSAPRPDPNERRTMGTNRMEEFLRDPTLEQPAMDFYEVRLPWTTLQVRREAAGRLLRALQGFDTSAVVRVETVTGSVVYIRVEYVVLVQESTQAQRKAQRKLWKALDDEDEEEEYDDS